MFYFIHAYGSCQHIISIRIIELQHHVTFKTSLSFNQLLLINKRIKLKRKQTQPNNKIQAENKPKGKTIEPEENETKRIEIYFLAMQSV